MAGYLSANYPGEFYGGDYAKSFDFTGFFDNQRQKQEAQKNQELNRQIALQDLFHQQQMNPLREQEARLGNRTKEIQLPGIEADVAGKVSKQKLDESIPFEQKRLKVLTDLAKETSAAELESQQNQIKTQLLNPNLPPQVRKAFEELRGAMHDAYKIRMSLDTKESIAKSNNATRVATAPGPRAPAAARVAKSLEQLEAEALARGDVETADSIKERIRNRMQDKAEAGGTGKVDINELTKGGVPTRPGIQTTPNPATATRPARQEAAKASLANVQKMYPGVPADKLREAYKRKFGVDLK